MRRAASGLRGLFCPVLTPVDNALRPDASRFVKQAKSILGQGCHGVVVFGTTGEAASVALSERMKLVEACASAGLKSDQVMVGTGMPAVADTIQLNRHAIKCGFPNVLTLPPFYFKNLSDDGMFDAYSRIVEGSGEALRLYLYHIPWLSYAPISLPLIARLRKAYPNQVVGIKDSTGDWKNTGAILQANPGWGTFCGTEQVLVKTMRAGGVGCITATANVFAGQLRDLLDNWGADKTGEKEANVMKLCETVRSRAPIAAMKEVLARLHKDQEWRRVLPPLTQLPAAETEKLIEDVRKAGVPI